MNPMQMNPWYKSSKFWTMASGVFLLVGSVLSGEATVSQVVYPAIVLILGYFGIRIAESSIKGEKK